MKLAKFLPTDFKKRLSVVLTLTTGGFVLASGLMVASTLSLIEAFRWESHTLEVKAKAEEVLSTLKDIETGQRGYLLTQNSSYLEPYNTGVEVLGIEINELKELVSDNPGQVERAEQLEEYAFQRYEIAKKVKDTFDELGIAESIVVLEDSQGKKIMDDIRELVDVFQNTEDSLLNVRQSQSRFLIGCSFASIGLMTILGAIFQFYAYQITEREIALRQEKELEAQQARLEAIDAKEKLIIATRLKLGETRDMVSSGASLADLASRLDQLIQDAE